MVGVDTGPDATQMVDLSIGRDRAELLLVGVPVCIDHLSVATPSHAVAVWHYAELPNPAWRLESSVFNQVVESRFASVMATNEANRLSFDPTKSTIRPS